MATGHIDANGVWIYGEDDPASPASDLLNLGQESISDQIGLLRAEAWSSYAPVIGGFALGAGGVSHVVRRFEGDLVRVRYCFKFGTSGQTFPTGPSMSLPVAADPTYLHAYQLVGLGDFFDSSATAVYPHYPLLQPGAWNSVQFFARGSVTQVGPSALTPMQPFTWAAGDVISGELSYRRLP